MIFQTFPSNSFAINAFPYIECYQAWFGMKFLKKNNRTISSYSSLCYICSTRRWTRLHSHFYPKVLYIHTKHCLHTSLFQIISLKFSLQLLHCNNITKSQKILPTFTRRLNLCAHLVCINMLLVKQQYKFYKKNNKACPVVTPVWRKTKLLPTLEKISFGYPSQKIDSNKSVYSRNYIKKPICVKIPNKLIQIS